MTAAVGVALLAVGVLLIALTGPWLMRRSSAALVHIPRTAAVLLVGAVLAWPAALLSIGPMMAWVITGPVLPGRAGQVCQQCLAAANPWGGATLVHTGVPAVLLLAIPAASALALAIAAVRRAMLRTEATRTTAAVVGERATAARLHGHTVLLIDDPAPQAFTLPARRGGIVMSSVTLRVLEPQELRAILEHEAAHLRQHHHLLLSLASAVGSALRWVPLIDAALAALPHYLEIAADDAARRRCGTAALAGALLRLGEPVAPAHLTGRIEGVLHAAGPHRIGHLVSPGSARAGRWPTLLIGAYLGTLIFLSAAVGLPYAGALASGCF